MASQITQQTNAQPRILRTTGHITSCDVIVDYEGSQNRFHPIIEYRYTVANQTYTCSRITPDHAGLEAPYLSRRQVEKLVRSFSQDQPVTVYYNSANPADAFLIKSGGLMPLRVLFGS